MAKIKVLIILFFIAIIACNPAFARRVVARDKACFSNQRVLQGALEMYNMDHEEMLHEMNDDVIELLKKEKYIKGEHIYCPEKNKPGYYRNNRDLCEDGVIYCEYHGSCDRDNDGKQIVPPCREVLEAQRTREYRQRMDTLIPLFAILGLFSIILVIFWPSKKKK